MPGIKIVLDTNVFLRNLLGSPLHSRIFKAFKDGSFEIVLSVPLLKEVVDVLNRPEFKFNTEDIKKFLHSIEKKAIMVESKTNIHACRDDSDNIILEAAVSANANIIVTNDKDLLVLNPFHEILVLSPNEFLERLE